MVLPQSNRGNRVAMTFNGFKRGIFAVEALNGFASTLYFNYLFFYLKEHFQFGAAGNLTFGGIMGFVYIFGSFFGGKHAQRRGYLSALQTGLLILIAALCVGVFAHSVALHAIVLMIWTIGISQTWPSLEAISCEGESSVTLPRKVGIYNVVWAAAQGLGYFLGGGVVEFFGWKGMFLVPIALHTIEFGLVRYLCVQAKNWRVLPGAPVETGPVAHEGSRERNKAFLRMAWVANPFAYIAMNTVVPLIPMLAARLQLSPMLAGIFCSTWMFSRMVGFAVLWKWEGWHYHFGWLLSAYLILIASFAALLLAANLWVLVAVQIVFGWAVGLIYYSSLFYAMDASDSKGEHGGLHEAAIGAGIFGGPAIGVTALYLFPNFANSSVCAVSAALTVGLGALLYLRRSRT
jgi:predicted MFS family arabinose efflux permease